MPQVQKAADRADVSAALAHLARFEPDLAYADPRVTDRGPMQPAKYGAFVSYHEVATMIAAQLDAASTSRDLEDMIVRLRMILYEYADPVEGWREVDHADAFEASRELVPDRSEEARHA